MEELSDYLAQASDDELFAEVMMEQMQGTPTEAGSQPYEGLAEKVLQQARAKPRVFPLRKLAWAAAACLVLFVSVVLLYHKRQPPEIPPVAKVKQQPAVPVVPGKSGAILTLADGSTVELDSLGNGKIASQNGADVILNKGKLAYNGAAGNTAELVYNTLSTPRGRQYRVQLPDGTEVWLNAASSIHYPTAFTGSERVVDLMGEAYFEVAKDAEHPFKVRLSQQAQIDVLGTHFNVNAYANEPAITTTLLEGSVRMGVDNEKISRVLGPGQQTRLDNATHRLAFEPHAETAKAMAWRNGIFDFNDVGMKEAMQQLERWYDIDVEYEKNIPDIHFYGKMTRNIPLNDLLVILERSGVHFQIDGHKLIVKP